MTLKAGDRAISSYPNLEGECTIKSLIIPNLADVEIMHGDRVMRVILPLFNLKPMKETKCEEILCPKCKTLIHLGVKISVE